MATITKIKYKKTTKKRVKKSDIQKCPICGKKYGK